MSSLQHIERIKLEKLFEMNGGYVCDFSDRTFRDFVLENTGVDVYATGYEEGGTSKANRLRTFWRKESNTLSAKLILALLDYWRTQRLLSNSEIASNEMVLYEDGKKIADRISGEHPQEQITKINPLAKTSKLRKFLDLINEQLDLNDEADNLIAFVEADFRKEGLSISDVERFKDFLVRKGIMLRLTEWKGDPDNPLPSKHEAKLRTFSWWWSLFGGNQENKMRKYVFELTSRENFLKFYHQSSSEKEISGKSREDANQKPMSGLIIEAAGNIKNSGEIWAHKDQVVSMRSLKDIEQSGKIKFSDTFPPKHFIEKLTNNQTFAIVAGTLIVLVVLYVIYHYWGINLAQFR